MNQSPTNDLLVSGGTESGPALATDAPAGPGRVTAPLSSRHLRRGQAVELFDGRAALILGVIVSGQALIVFLDGRVRSLSGSLVAAEITDLPTILTLTRQALDEVTAADRVAAGRIDELETEAEQAHQAHQARLAEIRAYAIDRYQRGYIFRAGLNEFLAHLDLCPYRPHIVTFTVTGRFELHPADGQSLHEVETQVRDRLMIDTTDIDGVVKGSVDFRTTAALSEGDTP